MKKDSIKIIGINFITCTRLIGAFSLPFIFAFKGAPIGSIITIILFATDFIDGFLARKLKASTFFGAGMDALCDKLLNICSFSLLSVTYNTMFLPLLLELLIMLANYSSYRCGANVKSSKLGKIKTFVLDVLVILSFCIISTQVFNTNKFDILIKNTPKIIEIFSYIIILFSSITLTDYIIKFIKYKKSNNNQKNVISAKQLKPLNKLMSDLLSINYYNKHKEESILEQFYI